MEKPASYCEAVLQMDETNLHRIYHDTEYGFPLSDDNKLFERLILEINQAGLSWTTILKKKDNFKIAFQGFDLKKVAAYEEEDRKRLLNDPGIIRNRLKIDAAIHNAKIVLQLREEYGSFKNWLDIHHPRSLQEWTRLFKQTFHFTGGEIVNEFLMSTGYLPGAHIRSCKTYKEIIESEAPWLNKIKKSDPKKVRQ